MTCKQLLKREKQKFKYWSLKNFSNNNQPLQPNKQYRVKSKIKISNTKTIQPANKVETTENFYHSSILFPSLSLSLFQSPHILTQNTLSNGNGLTNNIIVGVCMWLYVVVKTEVVCIIHCSRVPKHV